MRVLFLGTADRTRRSTVTAIVSRALRDMQITHVAYIAKRGIGKIAYTMAQGLGIATSSHAVKPGVHGGKAFEIATLRVAMEAKLDCIIAIRPSEADHKIMRLLGTHGIPSIIGTFAFCTRNKITWTPVPPVDTVPAAG